MMKRSNAHSEDFALKLLDISYAITDLRFNIKDFDQDLKRIVGIDEELTNKKITILFPNIQTSRLDHFYKVKTQQNKKVLLKQSMKNINGENFYLFFVLDNTIFDEISKQVSYLNHQQYLYNEMLNKLEDGIYITDEIGKTLYINDAFINLSGLSRDSLIGYNVQELKRNNVLPNSCCEKVIETRQTVTTINNYYQGQKCLVTGSMINDENGEFKRTIAVIRDVSELDILMKKAANEETLSFMKNMNEIKPQNIKKEQLVMNNEKVLDVYNKADKFADIDSTVLILGETGVGKDFLASYIHSRGTIRSKENMIKINCAVIPEHLIESELFGYENGAFTGAQSGGKKGLFDEAGKGTIFLDEIGDMPYTLQVKLLNALNDKKYYRIGGTKALPLKARIIAATNADIKKLVDEKKFRADLYYRLNVINLKIPPLRERKEDIIPLSQYFLEYYNNKYRKNCFYSSECLQHFLLYPWNGNIREMKNLIERLVLIAEDACIDARLFREQVGQEVGSLKLDQYELNFTENSTLKEKVEQYERTLIEDVIGNGSTLKEAAALLGIDISTLVRKKQKHGL